MLTLPVAHMDIYVSFHKNIYVYMCLYPSRSSLSCVACVVQLDRSERRAKCGVPFILLVLLLPLSTHSLLPAPHSVPLLLCSFTPHSFPSMLCPHSTSWQSFSLNARLLCFKHFLNSLGNSREKTPRPTACPAQILSTIPSYDSPLVTYLYPHFCPCPCSIVCWQAPKLSACSAWASCFGPKTFELNLQQ